MSSVLYTECVIYDQRAPQSKGLVKTGGLEVQFNSLPKLEGLPNHVAEIYYAPQVRVFEIRVSADAKREMYPFEVDALNRWMRGLVAAVQPLLAEEVAA